VRLFLQWLGLVQHAPYIMVVRFAWILDNSFLLDIRDLLIVCFILFYIYIYIYILITYVWLQVPPAPKTGNLRAIFFLVWLALFFRQVLGRR